MINVESVEPLVSVIVPAYNRAETIGRAITSIIEQTYTQLEILVIDDASTDNTYSTLQQLTDSRLKVFQHETNLGAAAARNTGLKHCKGDFIAFLDSDDEWMPEKLELQLEAMSTTTAEKVFSITNALLITEKKHELLIRQHPQDLTRYLHRNCGLGPGSSLVLTRQCFETVGFIDEQFGSCMEDWDWILRMAHVGRYVFLDKALSKIHFNENPRKVPTVIESTEKFLEKHALEFEEHGARYKTKVSADHLTRLACVCAAQNEFRMGTRYLLKSLWLNPFQRPVPVVLVLLTMMDKLLGSRMLSVVGELRSKTRTRKY